MDGLRYTLRSGLIRVMLKNESLRDLITGKVEKIFQFFIPDHGNLVP